MKTGRPLHKDLKFEFFEKLLSSAEAEMYNPQHGILSNIQTQNFRTERDAEDEGVQFLHVIDWGKEATGIKSVG